MRVIGKLLHLLKYCNGTQNNKLTISIDNLYVFKWYMDSAFAVHPDFRSHMGSVIILDNRAIQSVSKKQKLNTKSSTISELVAANNISTLILWINLFMEEQGYKVKKNILFQDNKSTILLENNGKLSSTNIPMLLIFVFSYPIRLKKVI